MIIHAPCHFLLLLESFDKVFLERIHADMVDAPLLPHTLSEAKIHRRFHAHQADVCCLSYSTTINLAVVVFLHPDDAVHVLAAALVDNDDDEAVAAPEDDDAALAGRESKVRKGMLEPD